MHVPKHTVVGLLAVIGFTLIPSISFAQSPEQVRIAMLREVVALLQLQLEVLLDSQAASDPEPAMVFDDDQSFLDQIDADIVARYSVTNMTIEPRSNRHREYFERVGELVPQDYQQYFAEFVIFESGKDEIGAFVETEIPYTNKWRYAVNEDELRHPLNSTLTGELIVHEFGHIFSLHEVFSSRQPNNCHPYFGEAGCAADDTLFGKFLTEFWTDDLLDRAVDIKEAERPDRATDDFYDQNEELFVSQYAASSPAEDFAESFAHFVLYDDQSYGNVADDKVSFFNRFSNTRSMKKEILDDF